MKSIIICADDYGLNSDINLGIINLVRAKRLSAVSCMTNVPDWMSAALQLKPLQHEIDLGLHFNLTHDFGSNKHINLPQFILRCLLRVNNKKWISEQLHLQLDNFEAGFNRPPSFIDGHHHIHVFPQIRHVIFDTLNQRYSANQKPWLRRVNPRINATDDKFKALLLNTLAYRYGKDATESGQKLSGNFAGLYSLTQEADYSSLMRYWLEHAENSTLIMCHPALSSDQCILDKSMIFRNKEYNFFNSSEFEQMCRLHNISIDRMSIVKH